MAGFVFEVTDRAQTTIANVIYAEIEDLKWKMTLYFDIDTGNILYPVTIAKLIPDIRIAFYPEDMVECSLSPSILESEIDTVIEHLNSAHDVIAAARKLIKEEQGKLKNSDKVIDEWLINTGKSKGRDSLLPESWEIESQDGKEWNMESWE